MIAALRSVVQAVGSRHCPASRKKTKANFSRRADPENRNETPRTPGNLKTKTEKRDTSCPRNFLLQQRQTAWR
jgi:hypothetical protein